MSKLRKGSTIYTALCQDEEPGLQQQLQKRTNYQRKHRSKASCRSNSEQDKEAQSQVPSLRKTVLSELFLLYDTHSEKFGLLDAGRELALGHALMREIDQRPIVYIMGPYSSDPLGGVLNAVEVADLILDKGGIPYIPHLTHYWNNYSNKPWIFWMIYDMYIIDNLRKLCGVRLPGPSKGADMEEAFFNDLKKKVYSLEQIQQTDFMFKKVRKR